MLSDTIRNSSSPSTKESDETERTNIAVLVSNISKCYRIYERPQDRLKQAVIPRLQRFMRRRPTQYARDFWALSNVSFAVKKGETIGVIGCNGSGKSTLLQIVCGTLTPTSGEVQSEGKVAALLELGSGFNPEFTGRENVYLNGSLLGLTKEEIDGRFPDIARFADIGDFMEQPVKIYSSGMAIRLAFAVIAHVNADILIIDEALAVGDAFFVQKCMRFLRNFMERGTVLFVSHDTAAVVNLCHRAIWLERGCVREIGNPKEITESYLANLVESRQGVSAVRRISPPQLTDRSDSLPAVDQRLRYVNSSPFRNDIELFQFDTQAPSYGRGGATIASVQLYDTDGSPIAWCVGGEEVTLKVQCIANQDIPSPIVGFYVKDRLGQPLFGDNTYLTMKETPLCVRAQQTFEGSFRFRMPILPVGDYSFSVAIAEGTQADHVQHHWVHDAFFFKSHSSSVSTGLVGIPIEHIELQLLS